MTTTTTDYKVQRDATADQYFWEVVDADGDAVDCFETRAEALAEANTLNLEAETEALKEEIEGALYDGLSLDMLRKLAALIKAGA